MHFRNLPEIVYHPGTFGIPVLFSTHYDLRCKKTLSAILFKVDSVVIWTKSKNICVLGCTKVILSVYPRIILKFRTRQKALMTTAGNNYI